MKTFPTALFASTAAALALTFAAAPAQAGGWLCWLQSQGLTPSEAKVDSDLDLALDVAKKGLDARLPVFDLKSSMDVEDFDWAAFTDQCEIQQMLNDEVGDLFERAAAFRAHEKEFNLMKFHIVLGRYERAVQNIVERWKSGGAPDDIVEKLLITMRVDAFEYLASLGHTDFRARLQEAVTTLIERGQKAIDRAPALREMYVKVYTVRLESALAVLQDRIASGKATKQDFFRLNQIVAMLDRLNTQDKPYACTG